MGGHHSSRPGTEVWLTPVPIIDALGGADSFDLDPAAAVNQPWPTARRHYTVHDNGLVLPWSGRVWCNPPYSRSLIRRFMARLSEHGNGIALIFARTETEHFHRYVWPTAHALLFMRGRVTFYRPDGSAPEWDGGAPSVLIAYGQDNTDALAGCGLDGAFVPLRWQSFVAGYREPGTWMEELTAVMRRLGTAVSLGDLYREMAAHPKALRNPHFRDKIRQVLQKGPFERVGDGIWKLI